MIWEIHLHLIALRITDRDPLTIISVKYESYSMNEWLSFDRCDDDRNYDLAMNDSLGMDCGGEYAESTYGSAVGSSGRESKPDYYYLQYY